jgi:hypothetical protein
MISLAATHPPAPGHQRQDNTPNYPYVSRDRLTAHYAMRMQVKKKQDCSK